LAVPFVVSAFTSWASAATRYVTDGGALVIISRWIAIVADGAQSLKVGSPPSGYSVKANPNA
jgi:hypothetical protein